MIILTTIILSLVINSYSFFQYSKRINDYISTTDNRLIDKNYLFSHYNEFVSQFNEINEYTQELEMSDLTILKILNFIKIIFSDLFFVIVTLTIDILLFYFIKKKSQSIAIIKHSKAAKKIKNNSSQRRLSAMIILNGINFLFLRTPSLILSFYGFIFRYDRNLKEHLPNLFSYYVCRTLKFCNLMVDVSFLFYLLSFIVQFLVFFKLDTNWKKIFNRKKLLFREWLNTFKLF